jgi:hypothetical protein
MNEFKVGDRVRATQHNAYTTYDDQTIEVGTEGTVVDAGMGLLRVKYDAQWLLPGLESRPVVLNTFLSEVEKIQ